MEEKIYKMIFSETWLKINKKVLKMYLKNSNLSDKEKGIIKSMILSFENDVDEISGVQKMLYEDQIMTNEEIDLLDYKEREKLVFKILKTIYNFLEKRRKLKKEAE